MKNELTGNDVLKSALYDSIQLEIRRITHRAAQKFRKNQ